MSVHYLLEEHPVGAPNLLVYVDDMIISGNNIAGIKYLKDHLTCSFKIKDLGHLTYFLELEISFQKFVNNLHLYFFNFSPTAVIHFLEFLRIQIHANNRGVNTTWGMTNWPVHKLLIEKVRPSLQTKESRFQKLKLSGVFGDTKNSNKISRKFHHPTYQLPFRRDHLLP